MITIRRYYSVLFFLLLWPFSAVFSAEQAAIQGYSPVSYFTENRAEKGSPEFAVSHNGKIYYLTSAEQVALFNEQPEKYKPRWGYCPYSLSLGKRLPLDPQHFKIVGETLLLFHKSEDLDGQALWESSPVSEQELLDRADHHFKLLEFD